jgi:5-methylcytosine-specific restriction endonuclease McrA
MICASIRSNNVTNEMHKLDPAGMRLLNLLVNHVRKLKPGRPPTFLGYKNVHDLLGLSQQGRTYGESLQRQGLNTLADWTEKTAKPAITGFIIDKSENEPGEGYFTLFGRKAGDYSWWNQELTKSISFDWEPFIEGVDDDPLSQEGSPWTEDELRASVHAYLEMHRLQRAGKSFTKTDYYNRLSERFGRKPGAYERRMQNISYVLSLMGRDWLPGLKPLCNVGANIGAQLEALIAEAEGRAYAPVVAFEIEVHEDLKKKRLEAPKGNQNPRATVAPVTQYQRDPAVKAWVLREAKGVCECCNNPAPFKGQDGTPFLEVHHVVKLADDGPDTITNAVAICPNCHRELHYGGRARELVETLYDKVRRLVRPA